MKNPNQGQIIFWAVFAAALVALAAVVMSVPIQRPVGEARVLPNEPGYDPLCKQYQWSCPQLIIVPGDGDIGITPPNRGCRLFCAERWPDSGVGIFGEQSNFYPPIGVFIPRGATSGDSGGRTGSDSVRQIPPEPESSKDKCLKDCDLRGGHMEDCNRECKGKGGGSNGGIPPDCLYGTRACRNIWGYCCLEKPDGDGGACPPPGYILVKEEKEKRVHCMTSCLKDDPSCVQC